MKIKSLTTTSFGKFESKSTWNDFSPSVNVFYGENEAGKSTIFEMIISLLYGFKSTNKEKNLFVNRNTNNLNISGLIDVGNEEIFVDRELKSKANLRIIMGSKEYVYDNQSLPQSEHITRKTYEEIYALELSSLIKFQDTTWSDIEDLLLSQYSSDTFKTSNQVLEIIEKDMNQIKRKSERGNSILKSLEEQRKTLFKEKKESLDYISKADDFKEKLDYFVSIKEESRTIKLKLENRLTIIKKYFPLMELSKEKKVLSTKLLNYRHLKDLNELNYLEKKNQLKTLYVKMDEVSNKVSKLVYEKRKLIDRIKSENVEENELEEKIQYFKSYDELKYLTEGLDQKLLAKENEFKKEFDNTFNEVFNEGHFNKILNINFMSVKTLISEIEKLNEEIKIIKRSKRLSGSGNIKGKIILAVILGALGVSVNFLDLGIYDKIINSAGYVIVGASVIKIIELLIKSKNKQLDDKDIYNERDEIKRKLVIELSDIALSAMVEEYIGSEFLGQLLNLKNITENYLEYSTEYDIKKSKMDTLYGEVEIYIKKYNGTCENMSIDLAEIKDKSNRNKKLKIEVEVLDGQLKLINAQIFDLDQKLTSNENEVNSIELKLRDSGDSIEDGLEKLRSINHIKMRIEEIEKKMEETIYKEESLIEFIKDYSNTSDKRLFNDSNLIEEIDIIKTTINDNLITCASLEKDMGLLLGKSNIDVINSKILFVNEEINKFKKKYDKLNLMYQIIQETDEIYRKENQPNVFKKAGKYLSSMTGGKYYDLEVLSTVTNLTLNSVSKEIFVSCDNKKIKVNESFSQGTLNQIYLSLRLALLNQLDEGKTKLPICFDELLINWDEKRLGNTLKIIKSISVDRQVMIFTCHEWFKDSILKELDAKVHYL